MSLKEVAMVLIMISRLMSSACMEFLFHIVMDLCIELSGKFLVVGCL